MFCIDRAHWLYGLFQSASWIFLAFLVGQVSGAYLSYWFRVTRLRIKRRMRGIA